MVFPVCERASNPFVTLEVQDILQVKGMEVCAEMDGHAEGLED